MTTTDCTKTLVIYGAGGLGREILDIARSLPDGHAEILFADDGMEPGAVVAGHRVIGGFDHLCELSRQATSVVIGLGKPAIRAQIWQRLRDAGVLPATVIDPTAVVRPSATVKPGAVIGANVFISCGAVVHENAVIGTGAMVAHDAEIGPHSAVRPLAIVNGTARLGEASEIGAGAIVMPGRRVADHAIVAMGAAAFVDVGPNVTVIGNPARILSRG